MKESKFRFTHIDTDTIYTATPCNPDSNGNTLKVTWTLDGCERSVEYSVEGARKNIKDGYWIVLTNEKPLPDNFQFYSKDGEELCEASKVNSSDEAHNAEYLITWGDFGSRVYDQEDVEANVKSLHWTIINSITDDEDMVDNNPYDEATFSEIVPAHNSAETEHICGDTTYLDAIKYFTEEVDASVTVSEGGYTVFYEGTDYCADSDLELWDLLEAIKVLEGCKS